MRQFNRRLNDITTLCEFAADTEHNWWRDMLALWRPAGTESGEFGLRLAIRDDYLNLYRNGQSVARISVNGSGLPVAQLHIKYVGEKGEFPADGQEYVILRNKIIYRDGKAWKNYEGVETLTKWITRTVPYAGDEKMAIDKMLAATPNVIDLEMAIPAWGGRTSAPRIDLVALERAAAGIRIVFCEVKLASDGRVRCSDGAQPEVLKQLADYREFLGLEEHRRTVIESYNNAARLIKQLRVAADRLHPCPLGNEIEALALGAQVLLDPEPRLLVVDDVADNERSKEAWAKHAERLRGSGINVRIISKSGPFAIGRSA